MEAGILTKSAEMSTNVLYPLDKKSRAFTLFQKVQGAMRNVPNFGDTCKGILDAVMDEMDAENCSLMLKDPISGDLAICAARGKNEEKSVFYANRSGNGKRFKSGEGVAGWVLKEGQAVMLDDVIREPRFVSVAGLNNNNHNNNKVNSLICFPIREKDQVVGVFNLSHSKKGAFNEGDKLALAYISNQVGAALTSARFFLEINEASRLMKDPREVFSKEKVVPIFPPSSSTFVEVGEVTREEGIFIYTSDKMQRIKEIIDQIADTDVTVLIQGESGVGKEVVARSIHLNSSRRERPFVKVNCAALPQELLESELFGYEKGAFTGAYRQKPGKFELANGGTIFLDEISEISLSLQGKLLQVIQDREFSRLGGKKDIRVDVRVLVATNKNMEEGVKNGRFREDLYYRLDVVNITIPPLRERREEIPIFVEYFLDKFSRKYQKKAVPMSDKMMEALSRYDWSGNVRELENVIQRFVVLGNEKAILEELTPAIQEDSASEKRRKSVSPREVWPSLKEVHQEAIKGAECEVILRALEMTNWNRKKAADVLNISYKALLYKIKEAGLDKRSVSQAS
ncbi:MAG TPA: sigma 54-interacting transcriptional regulator [Thermodesulfobacteriota bacterium]|nr:sigma 54-interacting transcriptional regulator [Thermodesulfobacteriota bacterium]